MLIAMSAGLTRLWPSVRAAAYDIPVSLLPSEQQQGTCLLITITKLVEFWVKIFRAKLLVPPVHNELLRYYMGWSFHDLQQRDHDVPGNLWLFPEGRRQEASGCAGHRAWALGRKEMAGERSLAPWRSGAASASPQSAALQVGAKGLRG